MPPPITFPRQVMSGLTRYFTCAPPQATRNPVITSSNSSSAPSRVAQVAQALEVPDAGGTTPMLPATGSTAKQAISPGYRSNASRAAARSL